jgi:hypothetical protein
VITVSQGRERSDSGVGRHDAGGLTRLAEGYGSSEYGQYLAAVAREGKEG